MENNFFIGPDHYYFFFTTVRDIFCNSSSLDLNGTRVILK